MGKRQNVGAGEISSCKVITIHEYKDIYNTYDDATAEMHILRLNFLLYTLCGLWRPVEWSSTGSKLLYNIYTILVVYLIFFWTLAMFLDIVFVVDNVDDFIMNSFIFISVISMNCKLITTLTRRGRIINLFEILQRPPCKVCDHEEMDIQAKFDDSIRSRCLSYLYLATCSLSGALVAEMLDILQGQLPLRIWVPYAYTSPFLFWLTCAQIMIAGVIGTFINISTEILVYGLCLQTCAQLEILTHRLQKVVRSNEGVGLRKSSLNDMSSNGTSRLSKHVCHHLHIIRYAELVNEVYNQVIFIQFFASILVLCSALYYLSSHTTFEDIATMVVYVLCMFVQILVYCWAGNEVILKSTDLSDAIYEMDWILMPISERKDLLMIMMRSMRPIKFTSSFLVTLSLTSYGSLLKASYSAFSVLQQF